MATYKENMQEILRRYTEEVSEEPASLEDVAQWAIENKLWGPRPRDIVKICKEDLAEAARNEKRTDSKGRKYRARHSVRVSESGRQYSLWADMDTAAPSFMKKSFSQRRQQIVGDCHQMKVDVDHFNDERAGGEPYTLELNFTDDVAEIEALDDDEKKAG